MASSPQPASPAVTSEALRIGVCVEEGPVRDRVCATLAGAGHDVCARGATVEELVSSCNSDAPTCVVVAAERPDRSAVSIVRLIRSKLEGISAVLLCRHVRGAEVRRALELGVDGVVFEKEAEEVLAAVVAVVCAGQVSVPSGQRAQVRAQALTTRERQVLTLVMVGSTNAQIARKLFLAESTVKSHLSSAFSKLGVSSRNEAATLILDPDRGRGLGIATLPAGADSITAVARRSVRELRPVRR
jgi:DNA-binding NarL/FixJ family response regulator